jgi:hypothetical protein
MALMTYPTCWIAWFVVVLLVAPSFPQAGAAGSPQLDLRSSASVIAHSEYLLVQAFLPSALLPVEPVPLWANNVAGASTNISVLLDCNQRPVPFKVEYSSLWKVARRSLAAQPVYLSVGDSARLGSQTMASMLVGLRVLPLPAYSADLAKLFLLVSQVSSGCSNAPPSVSITVNGVSATAVRTPALHLHLPVQLHQLFQQQQAVLNPANVNAQPQPVFLQGGDPRFQPSAGLVSSGLFDPSSACAVDVGAFVTCVKQHVDISHCREEQRRYMRCQRQLALGESTAAEAGASHPLLESGDTRFSAGATAMGSATGTLSHLGSQAISHAAVAMGLDVEEVEALCSALGDGDCPVQTMTNVPLPVVPGNNVVSGQAMGPFGPDFSAVAGLVIGAIINGIVGPEIVEAVQKFMTKIMKVIPQYFGKL